MFVIHFSLSLVIHLPFEILELVHGAVLPENVLGTQEHDIKILQIVVRFALVQSFAIAHGLVVAGPLGNILVVYHLHLYIETAEGLSVRPRFLYKDIVADTLVERAYLYGLFGLGIPEFVDLDAKHRFEKGLGDFLVAEHHCKHEPVCDGKFFKRSAFCFHFLNLQPIRAGFRE